MTCEQDTKGSTLQKSVEPRLQRTPTKLHPKKSHTQPLPSRPAEKEMSWSRGQIDTSNVRELAETAPTAKINETKKRRLETA